MKGRELGIAESAVLGVSPRSLGEDILPPNFSPRATFQDRG